MNNKTKILPILFLYPTFTHIYFTKGKDVIDKLLQPFSLINLTKREIIVGVETTSEKMKPSITLF